MKNPSLLSWLMLAVWASWLTALQGWLASRGVLGAWTPDLSLVLLVSCAARFRARDVPLAAFLVALARIGASIEPPTAILAGFLGLALFLRGLRRAMEVTGPLVRSGMTGAAAWAFAAWLVLVHETRGGAFVRAAGTSIDAAADAGASARLVPIAMASAFASLVFGPALVHFPGLSPLRRSKTW